MHGDAIVPHGQVATGPSPSYLVLWLVHVVSQIGLQRIGFIGGLANDMSYKGLVEIQKFTSRNRVHCN